MESKPRPVKEKFRLVRVDEQDSDEAKKCLLQTLAFGWNIFGRVDKLLLTDPSLSRRMALIYFDENNDKVFVQALHKKKPVIIQSADRSEIRTCSVFPHKGNAPPPKDKFCTAKAEVFVGERIAFKPATNADSGHKFVYELKRPHTDVNAPSTKAEDQHHFDLRTKQGESSKPRQDKPRTEKGEVFIKPDPQHRIDVPSNNNGHLKPRKVSPNKTGRRSPKRKARDISSSHTDSSKKGRDRDMNSGTIDLVSNDVEIVELSDDGAGAICPAKGYFSENDVVHIIPHAQDCSEELAKVQRSKICENGGKVVPGSKLSRKPVKNKAFFENHVSHIVASNLLTVEALEKLLGLGPEGFNEFRCRYEGNSPTKGTQHVTWIVQFSWIRTCLKKQKKVPESDYLWQPYTPPKETELVDAVKPARKRSKQRVVDDFEHSPSPPRPEETSTNQLSNQPATHATLLHPISTKKRTPFTKLDAVERKRHIIQTLRDMGCAYEMRGAQKGGNQQDKWRKKTYDTCADAVEWHCGEDFMQAVEIGAQEEVHRIACRIDGIGEKMAEKVAAIAVKGWHHRMAILDDPDIQGQLALKKIHGVGLATARELYQQGYTSIEKLRQEIKRRAENNELPLLTRVQTIGLDSYEDLQKKIPRKVVEKISSHIERVAKRMLPGVMVTTCGSYRRGNSASGDVDILISNPNGDCPILNKLVEQLHDDGLLVADLNHPGEHVAASSSKIGHIDAHSDSYMGIGVYEEEHNPGHFIRCRIDIKVYPHDQIAYARIYFTGSTMFLRKLKLYALQQNLQLGHVHMTYAAAHMDTLCKNQEFGPRRIIPKMYTEEEIFHFLGLKYVPPTERNFFDLAKYLPKSPTQ